MVWCWGWHLPSEHAGRRRPLRAGAASSNLERMRRTVSYAILVLLLLSPATASAETYLTEQQALKIVLSKSETIDREVHSLSDAQRAQLQEKTGLRFPEKQFLFFVGKSKGKVDGYAVTMNEIGKHEFITFIVGMNPKSEVSDCAVMEFRESRGWEVREQRFLRQFRGKKRGDPIQVNRDIVNYTGATLSSHAIARGVKRALLLTELFYPGGKE